MTTNDVTFAEFVQMIKNIEEALYSENLDELLRTRCVLHDFSINFTPKESLTTVLGTLAVGYRGGRPPVGSCKG
jgi:hypothetical protein